MTTFIITAPNGKKYKITGDSAEGALAALQQMLGEGQVDSAQNPPPQGVDLSKATESEDWSQYPMDASRETDILVGKDELGNTIWRTVGGTRYVRGKTLSAPSTKKLSDVTLGDMGGAVGNLASGIVGAINQGITAPGRALAGDVMTPSDVYATSMFGVPLSPASQRFAPPAGPKAPPPETMLSRDVAAAKGFGIPVLRSDVAPPRTSIGKVAQRAGESIPYAGTGGVRAAQNEARINAAREFVTKYGADIPEAALDAVTADVIAKQQGILREFGGKKTAIVNSLKGKGEVPVPNAIAEIDRQIAGLQAQRLPELEPVIKKLEGFRSGLAGQSLDVLEKNRQDLGQMFQAPELAGVKTRGEKAVNAIYDPLRRDIAAFVKANGGEETLATWNQANGRIAQAMGEAKDGALRNVLNKGEATPETVRRMLFSTKPSDMQRLYKSLTPQGQARARTAIVQEALGKAVNEGDIASISPDKFKNALGGLDPQIRVFFKGEDFEAANGLVRALRLTQSAGRAGAAPMTGVQSIPILGSMFLTDVMGGMGGATASMGAIGAIARVYEATGVKRALRAVARAEGKKAEAATLKMLSDAVKKTAPPAGKVGAIAPVANSGREPSPYDGLFQRYGGQK
jgi:hypothetical protein